MQELGLKCGIEIHQQLEGRKLFCSCPTLLREDKPDFEITRKLRASAGESGKVDVAAAQEHAKDTTFIYEGYSDTTCLVECDEEPPHTIDSNALHASLQFSKMVGARASPVIQVMRKTVVDGSNTSGFQRTGLVARGGSIETSEGKVRIANISIEEDSAKILDKQHNLKRYCVDRLGIPLIEIGTEPDIRSPRQCQEAAKKIGMLLRSLPNVKRGLGTIRQDVNVSIIGGERVEIKGAQDLKMIPTLVEMEMQRQKGLLDIKQELAGKKLNEYNIVDVTSLFKGSESKIVKSTLEKNQAIVGMKLAGFKGLIGKELQPGYRVGTEFAGRAKVKAGVGGIFHSDELPNYGITDEDVTNVRAKLGCDEDDAFVLVATSLENARIALTAVYERAQELFVGVPKEVRKAMQDGTTRYMRPMPGAARMYPETDVPLIKTDMSKIELPELLEEKISRFAKEYSLSLDLAQFIAKSDNSDLFEKLVKEYPEMKPAFIADVLTSMLVEIRRKYELDSEKLTEQNFRDFFKHLHEGKIHKDIALDVLMDMIKGEFNLEKYKGLDESEIKIVIQDIIDQNEGAPMGALMGMCMKKFDGKVSGKVISSVLKELIGK